VVDFVKIDMKKRLGICPAGGGIMTSAGIYMARVEACAVPMGGSQPDALVVRGPRGEETAAVASERQ